MEKQNKTKKSSRRRGSKTVVRIAALVLAIAMVLSAGVYLFLLWGGQLGYAGGGVVYAEAAFTPEQQQRLDYLEDIITYIQTHYKDKVDTETLIQGIYNGLFDSLDDPYSSYYIKGDTQATAIQESLNNEYCGIGITMQQSGGRTLITDVNKKGPAYKQGVKPNTYIVKIDGVKVDGIASDEIAQRIRGEEGSEVSITTEDINGVQKTFTCTRVHLVNASVYWDMLAEGIAYLQVSSFSVATTTEFAEAYEELTQAGAEKLIIDLRDNGGGYVDRAMDIADMFFSDGVLMRTYCQGEQVDVYMADENQVKRMPTVLLTNEYTASAAEMFAVCLRDRGAATIVGETTFGKGVAQTSANVINGDTIRLSVMYFTGPAGTIVDGMGIVPDYIVYSTGQYTQSEADEIQRRIVPLTDERFYAGEYGLNVLAAQQRLAVLGYDVAPTGYMDGATMTALRSIQRKAGFYSYGNLDKTTIHYLEQAFSDFFGDDGYDEQLMKAYELLAQ